MYSAFGFTVNWANDMRAPAPSRKSRGSVYQPPNAFQPIGAANAGTDASTMAPPRTACASRRGTAKRGAPEAKDLVMVDTSLSCGTRGQAIWPRARNAVTLAPRPGAAPRDPA